MEVMKFILLHINFFVIAMLRVRMRRYTRFGRIFFKELYKVAQIKRNILTLTS